ncbi:MAG: GNAT family N-acetyltransferase [Candidatus Diapherotrites archaeon]|nr:GNAT family N-acetyltransferase [Candidatus Diapherotrites archaeon]
MNVKIRATSTKDFDAVKNILEESNLLQPDFTEKRFSKMLAGKGNCCCVVVLDKKVVGTAFAFNDGAFIGYIRKVAVDINFRRKNIASMLVENVVKKFRAEKIGKVFVHIEKDNLPSLKLFDSIGFQIVKTHYLVDKSLV